MKRFSLILLVALTSLGFAQSADEILAANVKAVGGATALEGLETYIAKGIVNAPNNMVVNLKISSKGNKILVNQTVAAVNAEMTMGCDGENCYSQDPYMGLRLLEGQEKEQQLVQNDLKSVLKWKEIYTKREYKGEDTVSDKPVYKVYLETAGGMKMTNYYDQKTYMLLKSDSTTISAMGEISGTILFDEYKDIHKGFKVPVKMRTKMMNMDMTMEFTDFEVNVDLPDSMFKLPEGLN